VTARWMRARDPDPEDPAHALARRATRHELRVRLLNLRSVTDAALGDRFTSAPREDELWPICAAAQQVGYRALAHGGEGDPEELRSELVRIRRELASR
jgi:hypothetical protein